MMVSPIFEMIDSCGIDVYRRQDDEWTEWKRSLQIATVFRLQPNENWLIHDEEKPKIQIKRMTAADLNGDKDDKKVIDHPYDDMLDVVKLPMKIPKYKDNIAPEFLFIRQDDYDLFFCMMNNNKLNNNTSNFLLIGNPGISKSWFHWKYLLFCYHPELYNIFKPKHMSKPKPQHDEQTEDDQKVQATPQELSPTKKQKIESPEVIEEESKFIDNEAVPVIESSVGEIKKQSKFVDIDTIPEVVVRTISGTKSQIFVINSDESVEVVTHGVEKLEFFTTCKMVILWEPDAGKEPVPYSGIMAQIIATLSPDKERFKEFGKNNATLLYLPCPSEMQLRLMGQIIRDDNVIGSVSDVAIQERIQTYGPFTRLILSPVVSFRQGYKAERHKEMTDLGQHNLGNLLANITDISGSGQDGYQLSHRIVRFMVNRNDKIEDFYGYSEHYFVSTCNEVAKEIRNKIANFTLEILVKHLVEIDNGLLPIEEFISNYLEKVFVAHSTNEGGLQWKYRSLLDATSEWEPKSFKFDKSENFSSSTTIAPRVIYYPSYSRFPLVDMFWLENKSTLCAVQATRSESHAKSKGTFELFFKKLKLDISKIDFHLYYLILPRKQPSYSEKKVLPPCTFFTNVKKMGKDLDTFRANFKFFAICPPKDFGNGIKLDNKGD